MTQKDGRSVLRAAPPSAGRSKKLVNAYLEPGDYARSFETAKALDVSMAELIRLALRRYDAPSEQDWCFDIQKASPMLGFQAWLTCGKRVMRATYLPDVHGRFGWFDGQSFAYFRNHRPIAFIPVIPPEGLSPPAVPQMSAQGGE